MPKEKSRNRDRNKQQPEQRPPTNPTLGVSNQEMIEQVNGRGQQDEESSPLLDGSHYQSIDTLIDESRGGEKKRTHEETYGSIDDLAREEPTAKPKHEDRYPSVDTLIEKPKGEKNKTTRVEKYESIDDLGRETPKEETPEVESEEPRTEQEPEKPAKEKYGSLDDFLDSPEAREKSAERERQRQKERDEKDRQDEEWERREKERQAPQGMKKGPEALAAEAEKLLAKAGYKSKQDLAMALDVRTKDLSVIEPFFVDLWFSKAQDGYVERDQATRGFARGAQRRLQSEGAMDDADVKAGIDEAITEDDAHLTSDDVIALGLSLHLFEHDDDGKLALPGDEVEQQKSLMRGKGMELGRNFEGRVGTDQQESGWRVLGMDHSYQSSDIGNGVHYFDDDEREESRLRPSKGRFLDHDGAPVQKPDVSKMTDNEVSETSGARFMRQVNKLEKEGMGQREAMTKSVQEMREHPRHIFVMSGSGDFHVTVGELGKTHHSSMMAGGSVASAGEIEIDDGVPTHLSDVSGHYKMSPAQTWQAVRQLEIDGFDVKRLKVELFGVPQPITGGWFLSEFDPTAPKEDPHYLSANPETALKAILDRIQDAPPEQVRDEDEQQEPEQEDVVEEEPKKKKKKGILGKISRFGRKLFKKGKKG